MERKERQVSDMMSDNKWFLIALLLVIMRAVIMHHMATTWKLPEYTYVPVPVCAPEPVQPCSSLQGIIIEHNIVYGNIAPGAIYMSDDCGSKIHGNVVTYGDSDAKR